TEQIAIRTAGMIEVGSGVDQNRFITPVQPDRERVGVAVCGDRPEPEWAMVEHGDKRAVWRAGARDGIAALPEHLDPRGSPGGFRARLVRARALHLDRGALVCAHWLQPIPQIWSGRRWLQGWIAQPAREQRHDRRDVAVLAIQVRRE